MLSDEFLALIRKSAVRHYKCEREPAAIELLSIYAKERHDDSYALFILGDCLRILGRLKEAKTFLLQAVKTAPSRRKLYVECRLGMLDNACGRFTRAEKWYARASKRTKGRSLSWLWILRGANLAKSGRFDIALDCYRVALECSGRDDEAHLNIGLIHRAKGEYTLAAQAFRRALSCDSQYAEARSALESLEGLDEAFQLIQSAS